MKALWIILVVVNAAFLGLNVQTREGWQNIKAAFGEREYQRGRRDALSSEAAMCGRLPGSALLDCIAPIALGAVVDCREIDGERCVCGKEPK